MFHSTITRSVLFTLGAFGVASPIGHACGPDFPNAYLTASFTDLTTLPTLSFRNELRRILNVDGPPLDPKRDAERQAAAELTEVRDALLACGVPASERERLVREYRRLEPPAALPTEFHLYAEGSIAWRENRRGDAVSAWRRLLALPPKERHYRTTWAAYRLGRALCDTEPKEAIAVCRLVQEAVANGFPDSLELAREALGWQARAHWRQQEYYEALSLYARQFALGVPSAEASLQLTLRRIFQGPDPDWRLGVAAADEKGEPAGAPETEQADRSSLRAVAEDRQLRQIVTAWFGARGGPALRWDSDRAHFERWVRCLGMVKNLPDDEADRWCWAAYQNGWYDAATLLAQKAPASAPAAEWVRAMLLLRAGFVDDAAAHLANAARAFETDRALASVTTESLDWTQRVELQPLRDTPKAQLDGVRAVLALRRERYTEALRLLVAANHWDDAAYIAERVLTLDELTAFVRSDFPAAESADGLARSPNDLRHLLARRLVRAGRFEDAREFFPPSLRGDYDRYLTAVRTGHDAQLGPAARADAFWLAARMERERGMELRGTELAPDYFNSGGDFEWPDIAVIRHRGSPAGSKLSPTPDELGRMEAAVVPTRRFHYRFRAADLAWLAAGLSPNDDEQTARILHTAGRWIANRDPERAQLFYQSLVVRCPNTQLGRLAAAKHWFSRPPTPFEP